MRRRQAAVAAVCTAAALSLGPAACSDDECWQKFDLEGVHKNPNRPIRRRASFASVCVCMCVLLLLAMQQQQQQEREEEKGTCDADTCIGDGKIPPVSIDMVGIGAFPSAAAAIAAAAAAIAATLLEPL
jgi:hypothetical protein